MHTTPPSLLEQLRRPDDKRAWQRFVQLYTPLLMAWTRQVGLQESDASDLIQDVFVLLLRKLPGFQYDSRKGFRAWLRTVTINRWREKSRRAHPRPVGEAVEGLLEPVSDERFWEIEYRNRVADRAVQVMRSDFEQATWQAFWQCVVEGRSAGEVGDSLGLTAGAVRAAKFRVLYRLRRELEGLMD